MTHPSAHGKPRKREMDSSMKEVGCPEPVEGLAFVYILLCKDGSFYTGQTYDVASRLELHKKGKGSKHTKDKGVLYLVYWEGPVKSMQATQRERQLKGWSRAKKIKLITGQL